MLAKQICDLPYLVLSEVEKVATETKDWVSLRLTKEARQCLKIFAAQHNMNMSDALIYIVEKANEIKRGAKENG